MRRSFELGLVLLMIAAACMAASQALSNARENARRSSCGSNLKNLGLGLHMYLADYSGYAPLNTASSVGWERTMTAYTKSCPIMNCPSELTQQFSGPGGGGLGAGCPTDYWMNGHLFDARGHGLKVTGMPSNKLLYGDGDGRKGTSYYTVNSHTFNPNADYARRHRNTANYAFVDGHVKWAKPEEIGTRWKW